MGAEDDKEKSNKSGPECFRELLRHFPSANLEDYYKNGQWLTELILMDTELIEAHRKESGAGEPIPLDQVKLPELPKTPAGPTAAAASAVLGALALQRPLAGSLLRPGASAASTPVSRAILGATVRALANSPLVNPKAGLSAAAKKPLLNPSVAAAAAAAATGPSADLREITLFIQKWGLEAAKGKLLLARLTPARRRWVMANFKGGCGLDQYIAQCDRSNAWAAAAPSSGKTLAVAASSALGVKRVLNAIGLDPSKRPRLAAIPARPQPTTAAAATASSMLRAAAARLAPAVAAPTTPKLIIAPRFKAPVAKPAMKPAALTPTAAPAGAARPTPKVGVIAAKRGTAKAGEKPGSLIRSLLNH